MGMNMSRVIVGGLAAGLVINIGEFILNGVILASSMASAMARLNLPPVGGSAIAMFVILGFALGILTVWLYAAIRPRYGIGPKTALCAGATVWFLAYLYPSVGMGAMGLFPTDLILIGLAWGLVEILIAALAGAWLYHEAPMPSHVPA
jgi:hypothetical protein